MLLRPVAAPPASDVDTALVGLSRAQLRRLLVQARPAAPGPLRGLPSCADCCAAPCACSAADEGLQAVACAVQLRRPGPRRACTLEHRLKKQFGADRWRATPSAARPAFLCDVLLEWLAQGLHWTARLKIAGASATTSARGPSHSCCPVLTCCGAAQLKAASAAGAGADLDTVTEELFRQLSAGQTVNLARLLPSPQPAPGAGAPRALPFQVLSVLPPCAGSLCSNTAIGPMHVLPLGPTQYAA